MTRRPLGDDDCLHVRVTADGSGTHVTMVGDIDMACQAELDAAARRLADRPGPVTIEMSQIEFMASCGVEFLARLRNSEAFNGHPITLINPRPAVRRVLDITGITARMDIADTGKTA